MREPQQFGRRLGDLLLAEGIVTPEQLGQAVAEQVRSDDKLGAVLVRLGLLTEEQLLQFLSRQYRVPLVEIPDQIPPDLLKLVPAAIARKYDVIPVSRAAASLTLAMADPTNLSALDEVSFRTGLRVAPALAASSAIRKQIEECYEPGTDYLQDVLALAETEARHTERSRTGDDTADLRASADQAPVVRLVNLVLDEAVRRGASDVHLDPAENCLRVRIRTDGMLAELMTSPKRLESAIVSRVKIMASLDIAERRLPQDGRIKFRHNGREVDFRVSVLPTVFGESVALRLLDKDALKLDLGQLGLEPWALSQFEQAVRSPNGVILITGPTSSGKTTTLYSALQTLNTPEVHIVTLEDPVEYNLRGINQVQVKEEIGLTFAAALRSFLRHDPNIILVGEMRDTETAHMAVRAALTGHLVLSTLHTNNCPATIARLLDMGLPPFLISSALRLVVAQRLVRKVCADCRQPYEIPEDHLAAYGYMPDRGGTALLYAAKGCSSCHFSGMKGRVALYEVMPVTPEICDLIMGSAPAGEIRQVARNQGMRTLREVGLAKALEGVTTLDEVLRVTAD
ncbi:MAG: Flp pilus assembly complex ATPase component TadA [Candidatus Rokubacteria bacterium]|nr:Flp pilus assembly complex ATPase component TadA [Candidatus Rokubacteria bacterium]